MCCEPGSHHGSWHWSHHHGGFCACGGPVRFGPRFWTQEEKIAWLEQYLAGLREEVKAVEERIAALKGGEVDPSSRGGEESERSSPSQWVN